MKLCSSKEGEFVMSNLFRRRSVSKSIKARTTAKYKRRLKKAFLPGYGKKGAGVIKDPKRSMRNAIYHRTTIDTRDLGKKKTRKTSSKSSSDQSNENIGCGCAMGLVFFGAFVGQWIGGSIGMTIGVIIMCIIAIFGMI